MTLVSAIIPTRDRPDLLRDCLRTLAIQKMGTDALEVLVVDDGSTCELEPVVREFASSDVPIRYERQAPAGLNAARNRGAVLASGELLAYLDDDTLVEPGWAKAVVDGFARTRCDGLAGRIELRLEGDTPPWLTQHLRSYLTELDLGPHPHTLPADRAPFGANCAVTREAFERIGGFRTGLDREGASLRSGGDVEFFDRLRCRGGHLVWWPDARVLHRVPADRLSKPWFRRRVQAQGIGEGHDGPGSGLLVASELLRAGRAIPILTKGLMTRRGSFSAELWLRYCGGRIRGRLVANARNGERGG